MADPVRFVPSYDFSDFQEVQPSTPLPGIQLDVQLADISTSTTELRDAIKDIRRSDGALVNGIVTEDSLEAGLVATLTAQTGADAVDAAVVEAEAAAAAAAATAAENQSLQTSLDAAIAAFGTGGFYGDYGLITDTPGASTDYGSIV